MKKLNYLILLLSEIILILIISCNKDDDIFSFVDEYAAPLTETKGATYIGNFFPFTEINYWKYTGQESVEGVMTMSYMGEKETESLDDSYSLTSTLYVNSPESVKLSSGTYSLFPVSETEKVDYETMHTVRYFEKTANAIYLRAIKIDNGNITEVKNPVYLKIPLVVGDRWETQPEINMESLMEEKTGISGDATMDMKCMIYVVGKELMNWKGNNVETVRLDERAQAKAKIQVEEDGVKGSMSLDLQITLYLNYLEGIGLISQNYNLSLSVTGSFSGEGEKITLTIEMDSEGKYVLSSYNFSGEKSAEIIKPDIQDDIESYLPEMSDNPEIQKSMEKSVKLAELIKRILL